MKILDASSSDSSICPMRVKISQIRSSALKTWAFVSPNFASSSLRTDRINSSDSDSRPRTLRAPEIARDSRTFNLKLRLACASNSSLSLSKSASARSGSPKSSLTLSILIKFVLHSSDCEPKVLTSWGWRASRSSSDVLSSPWYESRRARAKPSRSNGALGVFSVLVGSLPTSSRTAFARAILSASSAASISNASNSIRSSIEAPCR